MNARILIYAMNGTGLGHMMRLLGIAEMMRILDPELKILFLSEVSESRFLRIAQFPFFQIPSQYNINKQKDWVAIKETAGRAWEGIIRTVIETFSPDLMIYDTYISPNTVKIVRKKSCKEVFIFRERPDAESFIHEYREIFEGVDLLIFPNADEEESHVSLPAELQNKTFYAGRLIKRDISDIQIREITEKYAIAPQEFVVLVTNGGGTSHAEDQDLFLPYVFSAFKKLDPEMPKFKLIVFPGPLFKNSYPDLPLRYGKVIVRDFEPFLIDLMAAANLVISRGGMNTINEIGALGVPAVCIPAPRKYDDQRQRILNEAENHHNIHFSELSITSIIGQVQAVLRGPVWRFSPSQTDVLKENKIRLARKILGLL